MSGEYVMHGRRVITPVGPMARLALLTLGDQYSYPGPHRAITGMIADHTTQPINVAAAGVTELIDAGLLFEDLNDIDQDGDPAIWLAYVPGWEDCWEDLLWLRYPAIRRPLPPALRRAVMERDGGACRVCGSTDRPSIDHIHPVSRGGMSVIGNLQVLCRSHNSRKSNRLSAVNL
jgi:HNH endonuclease